MAYLIQRIKEQLDKTGFNPRTSEARDWLKSKVSSLSPNRTALMKDCNNLKDKSILGRMYFYFYDPKTKDTMPYYDRFPMVLVLEKYPDGFLGLNLHYLPIKYRIAFLDKLLDMAQYNKDDEIKRIIKKWASETYKIYGVKPLPILD